MIDLMVVAARNFMVHGRFASDGGSGSLFRSTHDVSCGSLVVALDVVRLFANGKRHPGQIIYGQNSGRKWQGMLS